MNEEEINEKIIISPFFDFLEKNDSSLFMKESIESICLTEFGAFAHFPSDNFRNDFLYIGESYIAASISLEIPLRKLFLLFPIKEMLPLYQIYHEMAPFRIIEKVQSEISHRAAFQVIMKNSQYNISQLAKILNCDRRTLMLLETNPDYEEKINHSLLINICSILNIDPVLLSKSQFVPYYFSLWNNHVFVEMMKKNITITSGINASVYLDKETIEDNKYILLTYQNAYSYKNKKMDRQISMKEFDLAISLSVKEYLNYCLENKIAYC